MKIFAIRDDETRPVSNLAYLFYYEKQKQFYIEIPMSSDPWDLPMILFNFARKGIYTLDAKWSLTWVSQRIIPPDRQNLGQILRDNGLHEYDEYKLLLLHHGRCSQDSCYICEILESQLPDDIVKRRDYKIDAFLPMKEGKMLVFFQNGDSRLCDIAAITQGNRAYHRLLTYYNEFRQAGILAGGYGIGWDEDHTISDQDLYSKGIKMPFSSSDFRTAIRNSLVDAQEAANILGCSRQYINLLTKGGKLQPVLHSEKSTIFLRSDLQKIE